MVIGHWPINKWLMILSVALRATSPLWPALLWPTVRGCCSPLSTVCVRLPVTGYPMRGLPLKHSPRSPTHYVYPPSQFPNPLPEEKILIDRRNRDKKMFLSLRFSRKFVLRVSLYKFLSRL